MPVKRRSGFGKYGVSAKENRTLGGIVFASKKEMQKSHELQIRQLFGEIVDLERQRRFPISVNGHLICHYVADFCFYEKANPNQLVVLDVKGVQTDTFRLKSKLFAAIYGFPITIT